jgi:HK97 family phage major capsid protein/HK97 family phage prohead protease
MSDELKLPLLGRDGLGVPIQIRAGEDKTVRLTFAASSELPVERFFGEEVLSHEKDAVRLDRVKRGAMPLLFNHNWDDPIGIIDDARIEDSRLIVDAHLFATQRAQEIGQMVSGGLRNVSLGYRINEVNEDKKANRYTATDWEPYEVSIVTVPADPTVGIGRQLGGDEVQVRMLRATPVSNPASSAAIKGDAKVSDESNAAAGASADVKIEVRDLGPSATQMEEMRVKSIRNMAASTGMDEGLVTRWVTSGAAVDKVSEDIMQIMKSRTKDAKPVTDLGLSEREIKQFSITRAIRACADQNWGNAGFEAEASREIAKRMDKVPDNKRFYVPAEIQRRDLTVASASGGGYLVGTQNQSFIDLLRNRSVAYRMGVTSLSGLQGSVTIPKLTGASTKYWLASESTSITESTHTFGQLALSPKTVGAYSEISRQLLLQSSPSADALVQSDLAQVVSLAVDAAVLNGAGGSGEPQGIIGSSGVGSVTGTSIAYAGIVEFQTDTATGNALFDSSGYVTTPAVAGLLKQRVKFSSTASPIWEGKLLEGTVDGYRAMASLQVPTANILFGDFSKVVLAEWGVLEVEVNPFANFQAGIIGVRAMYSIDVGVRYGAAFSLATSVT